MPAPLSSRGRRALAAMVVAGFVVRGLWAFADIGVLYDIQSLQMVADRLLGDTFSVYETKRWPYPPGYFPFAIGAELFSRPTGLPFHGLVQLPAAAADCALAVLVALWPRGASERRRLTAAALVAFGPVFILVSGFHGQIDSVAILPAALGVVLWNEDVSRRAVTAGLLIGLGAAIKTVPFFCVLALLPTVRDRREAAVLVGCAAAVPLVLIAPFLLANPAGTWEGLTFYRGVAGFGGLTAILQPELPVYWIEFEGSPTPSGIVRALTDLQNVIVGIAVLAAGAFAWRRRLEPLPAAVLIWLVVFAANPNYAFTYLIWGLPFFLLAGHLRAAAGLQLLASLAAVILYFRPVDGLGPLYAVLVSLVYVTLVVTLVVYVRSLPSTPGRTGSRHQRAPRSPARAR